jgi:hypothetical protein
MKKTAIPLPEEAANRRVLLAIKQNLDVITGAVQGEMAVLTSGATLADVIKALNEIIVRLNRSGT